MTDETTVPVRKKHRSPSYPAFDLETALQRTKQLASIAGRHSVPVSAALMEWGYRSKSSAGSLAIAAVKKFGLATAEGKLASRSMALTQLGQELVFYDSNRETAEWKERARKAALSPAIHAELWSKYGGELPADSVILPYLVLERGFSDTAAADVLKEFRRTIAFAELTNADVAHEAPESNDEGSAGRDDGAPEAAQPSPGSAEARPAMPPKTPSNAPPQAPPGEERRQVRGERRSVQIPYSQSGWALLEAEFPMSEAGWKQLIAVLQAMKPGLVRPDGEKE